MRSLQDNVLHKVAKAGITGGELVVLNTGAATAFIDTDVADPADPANIARVADVTNTARAANLRGKLRTYFLVGFEFFRVNVRRSTSAAGFFEFVLEFCNPQLELLNSVIHGFLFLVEELEEKDK
jgi:hypothetical protein